MWYRNQLCVPDNKEIKKEIMTKAHTTPYTSHPGSTKIYQNLKTTFWWDDMKREIAQFVSQCMTCQQVKIEHQRPGGPLQTMEVPKEKWKIVTMDFVTGLPRTPRGRNAIWVVVDRHYKVGSFSCI